MMNLSLYDKDYYLLHNEVFGLYEITKSDVNDEIDRKANETKNFLKIFITVKNLVFNTIGKYKKIDNEALYVATLRTVIPEYDESYAKCNEEFSKLIELLKKVESSCTFMNDSITELKYISKMNEDLNKRISTIDLVNTNLYNTINDTNRFIINKEPNRPKGEWFFNYVEKSKRNEVYDLLRSIYKLFMKVTDNYYRYVLISNDSLDSAILKLVSTYNFMISNIFLKIVDNYLDNDKNIE